MKFSQVKSVRVPEGTAIEIRYKGRTLWKPAPFGYVSLGDSIAAGYRLSGWDEANEYGKSGNANPTVIVSGSYTDHVRSKLVALHDKVKATSFARSGDTVADLMAKLDHETVRSEIKRAKLVTISIGANDVLQPAMDRLQGYLFGTVSEGEITAAVEANIAALNNDSYEASYTALLRKLYSINPNAQYVFTTVYNPYKYLYAYKGSSAGEYKDGFLGPLMWWVAPDGINDIGSALGFSGLAVYAREAILNTVYMTTFFTNANRMSGLTEGYVTQLNRVLREKVATFGKDNFAVADTKAVYDPVPDRPVSAPKHYNDLVNVEITRGYVCEDLNWGELWGGSIDWGSFAWDIITGDMSAINDLAEKMLEIVVEDILWPNVDPHPKAYGHHALYCSFSDALGWETLPRRTITYNAGTYGAGSMAAQTVVALDNMTAYTNIAENAFTANTQGYRFTGWLGSDGGAYSNGQFIGLSGDLALTAQWSNLYTVAYCKISNNEYVSPSGETGPVTKDGAEYYLRATLGGTVLPGLRDAFGSDGTTAVRTMTVPYGTELYIQLINTGGWDRGKVYLNDTVVAGDAEYCYYTTQITGDTAITFTWEYEQGWDGIVPAPQSYWIARITT